MYDESMGRIIVVRHGLTDWNEQGKLQGSTDIPLNNNGRKYAKETREILDGIQFDAAFSSPQIRAMETCEIVLGESGVKISVEDRLREREYGEYEGKIKGEFDYKSIWLVKNDGHHGEGVEDIGCLKKRTYELLDEIKEKYFGKTVLVVTHGGPARLINYYFNGEPKDGNYFAFTQKHSGFCEYKF